MNDQPRIDILPYKHRTRFFWFLVIVFAISLPSLIFYTTGYRLSFENQETSIITTGGMYVTAENLEVDVYLDEEQVERPRLFRSAYYIQNIQVGLHRIVVQRPDLQTWVKDLPVDPYVVTEASAFNMPAVPHLRPITRFETSTGTSVYFASSTPAGFFATATATEPYIISPTLATSTYTLNEEYIYVQSLFSTTSTSSRSVFEVIQDRVGEFGFSTTTTVDEETGATTTEVVRTLRGDMELYEKGSELYARWLGSERSVPYYFCVSNQASTSNAVRYGEHVATAVEEARVSTSSPLVEENNRLCRTEIKLDRLRQDVYYYSFFPNSSDLALLHLENGVYVTEIDDRAWQNTQLLYPDTEIQVRVENNIIYLKKGDVYFEIITEIEPI